jgi:hypothetical protein
MKRTSASLWIVRVLLILSAVATFGGIVEQLRIQQASSAQPTAASGAYTHALKLHGNVHFITSEQQSMLGLAQDGLYFGFPLLLILGIAHQVMMVRSSPVKSNYLTRSLDKRLKRALETAEPEAPSWVNPAPADRAPYTEQRAAPPPIETAVARDDRGTAALSADDIRPRQLMVDVLPLQLGSVSIGRSTVSFLFDDGCISAASRITILSPEAVELSHYEPRSASGSLALAGCFQKKLVACILTDAALYLRFEGGAQARVAMANDGQSGTITTRKQCIVF